MTTTPADWLEANQRYTKAALGVLHEKLAAFAARQSGTPQQDDGAERARRALNEASSAMPEAARFEKLCSTFGLSDFEADILLLCAGMEFDGSFALLCAAAQGDPRRNFPTFSLALTAFGGAHWSALSPSAPLRYWRLIELAPGELLTTAALRIDERILHYLAGVRSIDERMRGLTDAVAPPRSLADSQRGIAQQVVNAWSRADDQALMPVIQLCGDEAVGKRAIAATACGAVGLNLRVISSAAIPRNHADRDFLVRLLERESALENDGLLLECDDGDTLDAAGTTAVQRFLETLRSPLIVSTRNRKHSLARLLLSFDVKRPSSNEQRQLWEDALGERKSGLNGNIETLVSHFHLDAAGVFAAAARAVQVSAPIDGASVAPEGQAGEPAGDHADAALADALWDACRAESRPRLETLAQRIEPAAQWADLVLPDAQRRLLREIAIHVRQRAKVYEQWNFASKSARGLGISALFAGASGTGKTMAAEVLANELRLDLYRIDLSQVVSKYIGETEKNLRRVFDAADEGSAVLLFDEADALFGKRSEVKDSHDRYANIEISYLLQRMEAYRGLAILATNLKSALDHSFLRRIRFVVDFPFPDASQRAEIWRHIFPEGLPTEGLRIDRLARLNVAGGHIRNIAMNAAFLAADSGEPLRMKHLLHAVRGEYAKLDKSLTEIDTAGWA